MSAYIYNLMRLENPMHISIASVYWERWESMSCIIISMIFVHVASNLVRKHCKLLIITQFACITVQNRLRVLIWIYTLDIDLDIHIWIQIGYLRIVKDKLGYLIWISFLGYITI